MTAHVDATINAARDAAQQMVTACMHGHRVIAADIATEFPDHLVLALVLADLCAYTNHAWGSAVAMDPDEVRAGWREMMADIEEWRSSR